jgi:hypothetical protein
MIAFCSSRPAPFVAYVILQFSSHLFVHQLNLASAPGAYQRFADIIVNVESVKMIPTLEGYLNSLVRVGAIPLLVGVKQTLDPFILAFHIGSLL